MPDATTRLPVPGISIVPDACVLYPAVLRDVLLSLAEAEIYRLSWSDEILEEMRRNLVSDRRMGSEASFQLVTAMREAFSDALVVGYDGLIPLIKVDSKDRHVAAVAVAAQARAIVTLNTRHFPSEAMAAYNIAVWTPDDLLTHIAEGELERTCRTIQSLAARLTRPPRTVANILGRLAHDAPRFAASMRQRLELPDNWDLLE